MTNASDKFPPTEGAAYNVSAGVEFSDAMRIYMMTATALLGVAGIVLNSLVVATGLRFRQFRNSAHYAAAALSVAYLLDGSVRGPLTFARWLLLPRGPASEARCHVFSFTETLLLYACFLHLFVIAGDRYVAVMRPLQYGRLATGGRVAAASVGAWCVALALIVVCSSPSWTDGVPCFVNSGLEQYNVFTLSSFSLPAVVLLALYARIWRESRRQATRIAAVATGGGSGGVSLHRGTVTIGAILLVFMLSWVLFLALGVAQLLCACVPASAFEVAKFFISGNAVLNPLIFAVRSSRYRRAFYALLTGSHYTDDA
ncbi:PREDICTED: 5-hydroxytryptamine receptor 6-like [Priapulus caudatus]|uniref:5-hydroxytryptamine receptor 6-like n=1 Tax=Priapulus caudatus TaxID=37621 RepID=A0ABM1EX55_PRICU|nr:PREDICTED: 5-hydroxytryptamine receptor 6-like [Priapulus caudatus]